MHGMYDSCGKEGERNLFVSYACIKIIAVKTLGNRCNFTNSGEQRVLE